MFGQDTTISCCEARRVLSHWLDRDVTCNRIERLHGGRCYSVFRLYFDQPPYEAVIKLDCDAGSGGFARERDKLLYVQGLSYCPCPRVYLEEGSRSMLPHPFLLLESLPGTNLEAARLTLEQRLQVDAELADTLCELHSHTRETFGQPNQPGSPRWSDIFLPRLLELQQDMQTRLPCDSLVDIEAACRVAPQVFADQSVPTLVHGDVWQGNILVVQREDGWHLSALLDWPALQYADLEYELAYLEAWQTVTPAFFDRYTRSRPLRPGYEHRRLFYWLHTYMLHVWLFEQDEYRQRTAETARQIVRSLAILG